MPVLHYMCVKTTHNTLKCILATSLPGKSLEFELTACQSHTTWSSTTDTSNVLDHFSEFNNVQQKFDHLKTVLIFFTFNLICSYFYFIFYIFIYFLQIVFSCIQVKVQLQFNTF